MMLKTLVANWLREQAQQHVLNTVRDSMEQAKNPVNEPRPPCEIVILFATAAEAGGLVDRLRDRVTLHCVTQVEHSGNLESQRLAAVESGIGQLAAATAALEAIRLHHPRWLVCAGFASALTTELKRGHVLMPNEVVDGAGNRIPIELHLDPRSLQNNPGLHIGRLLTVDHLVRTPDERRQLSAMHEAQACDLETSGAAEACRQTNVRFLGVRVMTETLEDHLPEDVDRLIHQKTAAAKLGAAAASVWRRPSVAKDLWRFNEDALKASDRLARFLAGLLANLPK